MSSARTASELLMLTPPKVRNYDEQVYDEDEIQTLMNESGCSRKAAEYALRKNFNVVDGILVGIHTFSRHPCSGSCSRS